VEGGWEFLGKGKANPLELWPVIAEKISSDDFKNYVAVLGDAKEKVIIFDIPAKKWTVSQDFFDIARMTAGAYHGLPHRPYVYNAGRGIEESDVYNYLYCIAWTGLDCSGFVWHILSYIARADGKNLGSLLRRSLHLPRGVDASYFAGTSFFASASSDIVSVKDEIRNLRPADVLLFRAPNGSMAHSAIIQSIDMEKGVIRYLQNTDEAPLNERGAHESFILFKPEQKNLSLKSPELTWTQKRFAPFPGEKDSAFSDDGQRYRTYGGGRVVRLSPVATIAQRLKS
jgi:hypothetical protein